MDEELSELQEALALVKVLTFSLFFFLEYLELLSSSFVMLSFFFLLF